MKKSLLVLTAALSFGMAAAQTAAPASAPQVPALTDVPAGHWAKDAIDKLVGQGIILGYPDGTYRGTQNLTRYEAAVIIARLLDQVRTGEVPASSIDADTLTALQNAIQELAADLAALGVRVSDLEENAVSRDDFSRLEERVETIAASQGDAAAIANIQSQIDDLSARADDYDTLRADVDDNASSIAALNDLTVLLNQDILNLQDRVSAVEAAQADLVGRADFDTLSGRVGAVEGRVTTVETSVGNLDNRVKQLEKYAFSLRPTLGATYYVARGTRNMDFDRLIPGTIFSTGDDADSDTADTAVDYADLTGGIALVGSGQENFYGFSTPTTTANPTGAVSVEGRTNLSFTIAFDSASKLDTTTSGASGVFTKSAGKLNVNKVDLTFGVRAGLPSSTSITQGQYDNYPDVTDGDTGITYRPLFFYFKQGTADFTVGNTPVTVRFGKALKFKFADYLFDNDSTGRGDGFVVDINGSTVPVIGAYKPTITVVYGSRNGDRDSTPVVTSNVVTGLGGDGAYKYYRGVRATITPIGTLKAGLSYAQEGLDTVGAQRAAGLAAGGIPATTTTPAVPGGNITVTSDVTAFGADLHGAVAGWQIDSEYAQSRVTSTTYTAGTGAANSNQSTERAFYGKVAGSLGPVKVYNLNYRTVSAGYNKTAGIMEANPGDTDNGSTTPYSANQTGFGFKVAGALGPVALGAYWDNKVAYGQSPFDTASAPNNAVVDRGAAAKVSLFNLVSVRGGYYEYLRNATPTNADDVEGQGRRYSVRADVTPGLGLSIGAYYNSVDVNGNRVQNDGGLFAQGKYNSYFGLASGEFLDSTGCGADHPAISSKGTDGVAGALTFTVANFGNSTCYTEIGAELKHDGKDAGALVKDLSFRIGYASRYRNASGKYDNSFTYGDVLYGKKFGIAQVDLKGAFGVDRYTGTELTSTATLANSNAAAIGVRVVTDPLNVVFKPSFEGQVGYYTRSYDYANNASDYNATAFKYLAGVKLNEFLLPNTKLAVYYSGYQAKNRAYVPYDAANNAAGYYADQNNGGATVSQDLLYVEGNYYDLSFGYGVGNLRLRDAGTTAPADARGQVFKISYKVNF